MREVLSDFYFLRKEDGPFFYTRTIQTDVLRGVGIHHEQSGKGKVNGGSVRGTVQTPLSVEV